MSQHSASVSVRRSVSIGDRARRRRNNIRLIARTLPWALAASALLTFAAATSGWSRVPGLVLLVLTVIAAVAAVVDARREHRVSEAGVAELDRAADLGGALRSAHWFTNASEDAATAAAPDPEWLNFHLDRAAVRGAAVNWASVYAVPPPKRAWAISAVLALATIAAFAWPSPPQLLRASAESAARPEEDVPPGIPAALMPKIVEGMRAIKAGRTPSREALSAVGEALEIAKTTPGVKSSLERMFARTSAEDGGAFPLSDSWNDEFDLRAQAEMEMASISPGGFEWAYRDAASKAAASMKDEPRDDGAPALPMPAGGSADAAAGAENEGQIVAGALGAASSADNESAAESFSALLFGKAAAGHDGTSTANSAMNRAAISAALRREVVHAQRDVTGAAVEGTSTRRATNAIVGTSSAVRAELDMRYDRVRATRPPAVPDSRRALVHDLFVRPAEEGTPRP